MKSQTDKRIDGIPLGDTGLTIFFGNTTPTPLSDGVKEGDVWFVTLPSASSGNTEFECAYQYRDGDWVNVGYFPDTGVGEALENGNERFNDYSGNSITNSQYCTAEGAGNTLDGSYHTLIGGHGNDVEGAYRSIIWANGLDIEPASGESTAVNECLIMGDGHTTVGYGGAIGIAVQSVICGSHHLIGAAHQCLVSGEYGAVGGSYRIVVGNGNPQSGVRSNALTLDYSGNLYIQGALTQGGADYAETYEWLDGNPQAEERTGLFVTLLGDRIILADGDSDYILGVVSATPTVCGDTYNEYWHGKFERDVFGRILKDENGDMIVSEKYDPDREYIPQSKRPEKAAVGTRGKLVVRDDGTCKVNGYCKPSKGGIATASADKTDYRVIERRDENHIRIVIK